MELVTLLTPKHTSCQLGSLTEWVSSPSYHHLNRTLTWWARRKFKRLRGHQRRAEYWLGGMAQREPRMFVHWDLLGLRPTAG